MRDKKLLVYLSLGFIAATITGTLLHECGHYLAAKVLGFDARITYRSTISITKESGTIRTAAERFLITAGGPLQTILMGMTGLFFLYFYRSSFKGNDPLSFKQWTMVFLTLFWLRQAALLAGWIVSAVLNSEIADPADEIKIARHLRLPDGFFLWLTGIAGVVVLALVMFHFIPRIQRTVFLLAGLIGGIAGYVLWFGWLGKLLLP